jgi:hypothetical protein
MHLRGENPTPWFANTTQDHAAVPVYHIPPSKLGVNVMPVSHRNRAFGIAAEKQCKALWWNECFVGSGPPCGHSNRRRNKLGPQRRKGLL